VFAIGECLHGTIQAPLSVDLAPPALVGRYLDASSISWQIGWIIGPAAGGFLLQHRPLLLWPLAAAVLVFAVGECLHGAIHAPLSVDLAPPQLVGRYTAAASISWQIGWILGPAAGGFLLQHRPLLLWPIAAGVNLACAAAALALEQRLPERVRRTPRAEPVALPIPASG